MVCDIPKVSVVIPTRNRGDKVVATLESVFLNTYPNFEIILVDQSTNQDTADAIQPFLAEPRFRYIQTKTQGAGRARNIGLTQASGEFVAYTDDDCTVQINWLKDIMAIFMEFSRVAIIFCKVIAGPYNHLEGFIPQYIIHKDKIIRSMFDCFWGLGLGAGMALRREVIHSIGGFDNNLGPGSKFRAGEDHDIAIRSILKGWWVYETSAVTVTHYGFRTWKEGKEHTKRDAISGGATYIKALKCGHWDAGIMLVSLPLLRGWFGPFLDLFHGKRPHGFGRFFYFIKGVIQGLSTPVDNDMILYKLD